MLCCEHSKNKLLIEGSEALEQAVQRSSGCPISRGVQDQAKRGFGKPDVVGSVPAHSRVETRGSLRVRSNPNDSVIL